MVDLRPKVILVDYRHKPPTGYIDNTRTVEAKSQLTFPTERRCLLEVCIFVGILTITWRLCSCNLQVGFSKATAFAIVSQPANSLNAQLANL